MSNRRLFRAWRSGEALLCRRCAIARQPWFVNVTEEGGTPLPAFRPALRREVQERMFPVCERCGRHLDKEPNDP